ncbi:radical SAM protein [bacterium]|nr:radical SAM protein [bacterium]
MYSLQPLKLIAWHAIKHDPRCMARLERMLDALGRSAGEVVWAEPQNLAEVTQELVSGWPPKEIPEGVSLGFMRPLVFTTGWLEDELPDPDETLLSWPDNTPKSVAQQIMGHYKPIGEYHPYQRDQEQNRVCWPTFDFCTMCGCPHGCQYCGHGKDGQFITLSLNVEDYMDVVVPRSIAMRPWQKCFRLIGWSADQITVEPEYGAFDLFTRKLAEYDRYGYFHSAGPNVDWIADLERKDRLIGIFSVTGARVAEAFEPGTGDHAYARFEAGRKLNAMGVPVRYKFKPMIPIKGWREDYAAAIEHMMKVSQPESVGFCVIMWMGLEALGQRIPLDALDPAYVEAARQAADEMEGNVCAPFPHAVRKEIYQFLIREVRKYDPQVLLYISTESREMWTELADELGQKPNKFFCGCSPVALPGRKLSPSEGCPHSTFTPLEDDDDKGGGATCPR